MSEKPEIDTETQETIKANWNKIPSSKLAKMVEMSLPDLLYTVYVIMGIKEPMRKSWSKTGLKMQGRVSKDGAGYLGKKVLMELGGMAPGTKFDVEIVDAPNRVIKLRIWEAAK